MSRPARHLVLLFLPILAASVALAPAAMAQSPSPAPPACELVTADEVASAFDIAGVTLSSWSEPFDCEFTGDISIDVSIEARADLDQAKADYPEGVDLTVGGQPAWYATGPSGGLWVAVGEVVLSLDPWSVDVPEDTTAEALQATLVGLAELAIPRLPAGPDPAVTARLRDLVPDTLGGEAVTVQIAGGEIITGSADTDDPRWGAFRAAVEAQGGDLSTLVIGFGSSASGETNVILYTVPGTDAASLMEAFIALVAPETALPDTTTEIGGKQVRVIPEDPPVHVYAVAEVGIVAGGSEAAMTELFRALP